MIINGLIAYGIVGCLFVYAVEESEWRRLDAKKIPRWFSYWSMVSCWPAAIVISIKELRK